MTRVQIVLLLSLSALVCSACASIGMDSLEHMLPATTSEVRELAARSEAANLHVSYSRPQPEDREGVDYDERGRVDAALLTSLLPDLDAEFYLCGPLAFMADLQTGLEQRGVPSEQIHTESFGPLG